MEGCWLAVFTSCEVEGAALPKNREEVFFDVWMRDRVSKCFGETYFFT